jgi:uncharacterized protein YdaU (DUF1376 family)
VNYYPHHIGDFNNATRHLSRLERGIYRDLIEMYYDLEGPLPLDLKALCRKVLARTEEESTAVEQVLNEFFNETPTGWYHSRCEEEIEAYRSNTTQKSVAGKASAAKRALKRQQALNGKATDVEQTSNERATNQEPVTSNQEPFIPPKSAKPKRAAKKPMPDGFAISDRVRNWAKEKKHDHLELHFENFMNACRKHGYVYADWDEAFMGAVREDWAKVGGMKLAPEIKPVEQYNPGAFAKKGEKPEGLGSLKSLVKVRDEVH